MREAEREKEKLRRQASRNRGASKSEKDALVKSPKNFLEENISEAFKTLEVYQKALETERTRIHMGRVAPAAPPPVKRGAAKSKKKPVKGRGKVKIKPKKGKPAAK